MDPLNRTHHTSTSITNTTMHHKFEEVDTIFIFLIKYTYTRMRMKKMRLVFTRIQKWMISIYGVVTWSKALALLCGLSMTIIKIASEKMMMVINPKVCGQKIRMN